MNTIESLDNLIVGLQQLRDFLTNSPELAAKVYIHKALYSVYIYDDKEKFRQLSRSLAKGKRLKKDYSDYYCKVNREFNGMVSLSVNASRETVCERIVVGTKEIEAQFIPARTEEIVEWKCK